MKTMHLLYLRESFPHHIQIEARGVSAKSVY